MDLTYRLSDRLNSCPRWRAGGGEGEFQLSGALVDCGVVRKREGEGLLLLGEDGGQGIEVVGEQVGHWDIQHITFLHTHVKAMSKPYLTIRASLAPRQLLKVPKGRKVLEKADR